MTGFSDEVGCWKIIEMRLPRSLRISSCGELEQVLAVEHDLARLDFARASRPGRMIDSEVTLLPQPDSPTRPRISPRSTWKSTPVDRPDDAVAGVERGLQVPDVEEQVAASGWCRCRARRGTSSSMTVSSADGARSASVAGLRRSDPLTGLASGRARRARRRRAG